MNSLKTIMLALMTLVLLTRCNDDDSPSRTTGDYFPLEEGKQWTYKQWIDFSPFEDEMYEWGTLHLKIDGEMAIGGKTYKRFVDSLGAVNKIVRREGNQYFGQNHEAYGAVSQEYVFLDVSKDVGESWSYLKDGGERKTEYIIAAKNDHKTILSKEFHNVIEVRVNYYNRNMDGEYELWVTAWHYYAEGLGEVYFFYPYPVSNLYCNLSGALVNETK